MSSVIQRYNQCKEENDQLLNRSPDDEVSALGVRSASFTDDIEYGGCISLN